MIMAIPCLTSWSEANHGRLIRTNLSEVFDVSTAATGRVSSGY